jgi:hypothetical protein
MSTRAAPLVGLRGAWPFTGTPDQVQVSGRTFQLATWRFFRSGVTAQYRETVPTSSLHILLLDDGSYVVDHQDDFNPDGPQGSPLQHLVKDFIPSRMGFFVIGGLALAGLALVWAGAGGSD